jgi:hypothetical protein
LGCPAQTPDVVWAKEESTVTHKHLTTNEGGPIYQESDLMRKFATPVFLLFLLVAALPFQGYAGPTYPIFPDVQTTRERTVRPASLAPSTTELVIDQVSQYEQYGYSSWEWGAPIDYGPLLLDLSRAPKPTPVETLLSFFTMSDIHIVDKESPAQAIYAGVNPLNTGFGNVNTSAYSPIMLSTTHVLDAAVQTINALHKNPGPAQAPFDFGMSLGDDANNNQYNELRWFIDIMDGKRITPSSGAHRGQATSITRCPISRRASTSRSPGTRPSVIMTSSGAAASSIRIMLERSSLAHEDEKEETLRFLPESLRMG